MVLGEFTTYNVAERISPNTHSQHDSFAKTI